jgi:tRNA threonylcarbamoyladenosine biosynthesis protein TsaB
VPRAPLILVFDTSTETAVVAVGRGARALAVHHEPAPRAYDEGLVPRIAAVLAHAKVRPSNIDVVACGRGPGSFTGLRIALATAKGYAFALARPLVLVSSTAAMARAVRGAASVVVVLDAKRGQVFAQAFAAAAGGPRRAVPRETSRAILDAPELGPWIAAQRNLPRPVAVIGEAAPQAGSTSFEQAAVLPIRFPPGRELLALARHAVAEGDFASLDDAEPEYVRPPPFNKPAATHRGAKGSRG